jgi:thiamine biosynthesis lipoprotein
VPDPSILLQARARTGWQHLRLDPERRSVAFDREGIRINLGSIGKGHAIDRAAALIADYWWPTPALIHGGQSSLYALGSPRGRLGGRWEVAVRNPFQPASPLGVIRLRNRGLGTSGSAFQQFVIDGRVYGHILDPRSGEPASGPAVVTVVAPTAALADALSTAFYLLGADAARAYVADHPEIGVLFIDRDESGSSARLCALGLDEYDFTAS